MTERRYINQIELVITPQVSYNIAYMSYPEFRNYYLYVLNIKFTPEIDTEFYELWEDLKLGVIKSGVNKKLRISSLRLLKIKDEAKAPKQPTVKRGRGRPKKT